MNIRCAFDKLLSLSELKKKFNPKNRNKHPDDQVERLAKILEFQGVRTPVKVSNQSGFITSGHGRVLAAIKNGWTDLPVNFQDYDSEEQEYADVQSDNAIASWAELDLSGINLDIADLGPEFNIDMLGIKDFVLEPADKFQSQSDEDEVPEVKESICKMGDVWTLGKHRLMCGDSTSIDAVDKLMAGEEADMVFTDPPYGMRLDANFKKMSSRSTKVAGNEYKQIAGDDEDFDPRPFIEIFKEAKEQVWWGADYYYDKLPPNGSWQVWIKRNENMLEIFGNHFEVCWSKSDCKRKVMFKNWSGVTARNPQFKREHPTEKPISLMGEMLEDFSKKDWLIIDLFGGSGSTFIACEKTNRKCFMMELDPHYCDVIVARWEKYTGKKAELMANQ